MAHFYEVHKASKKCDQIELFFKGLGDNFLPKKAKSLKGFL